MNTTLLEPSLVTLPPGHPGEGDTSYIARRSALRCLVARTEEIGAALPDVQYTEAETTVWRAIMDRLSGFHEIHAASVFREGFRRLGMSASHPPSLGRLADTLRKERQASAWS